MWSRVDRKEGAIDVELSRQKTTSAVPRPGTSLSVQVGTAAILGKALVGQRHDRRLRDGHRQLGHRLLESVRGSRELLERLLGGCAV